MKSLLDAITQIFQLIFGGIWRGLSSPFKGLRGVFGSSEDAVLKKADQAYGRNKVEKPSFIAKVTDSPVQAARMIGSAIIQVTKFPFRFVGHMTRSTKGEFLWCLPALLAFALVAFVCFRVFLQNGSIETQYRLGALKAIKSQEFPLAKTYCQRLISVDEPEDADRLNWIICLQGTGQPEQAARLLQELAPNDAPGFPAAHKFKAMIIASQLEQTRNPALREPLRWHLSHSPDQQSEQIQSAYALYYVETKQLDRAVPFLEVAAKLNPKHYFTLGRIHELRQAEPLVRDAYRRAEIAYADILSKSPTRANARVSLANAVSRLDRVGEAEQILLAGLELSDTPFLRRALADFFLMRHDQSDGFDEQLENLQRSLEHDLNYLATYQRMLKQFRYQSNASPEQADQIERTLLSSVASGKATAMGHFALSSLYAAKEQMEESNWHINRAYELDPKFAVIANNLAWALAHQEPPDLDRAFELSKYTIEANPNDPRLRDTYATILMKQEKWEASLTEFERILGSNAKQAPIHRKLSLIYSQLGREKLAKIHQENALKLENTESSE